MHGHHTFKNISWPSVANKQHELSSWEDVLFKRTKQNNILRTYPHEERKDDWDLKQWAFFYIANEKLFRMLCLKLDEHHYSAFTAQLNPHPLVCEQYSLAPLFTSSAMTRLILIRERHPSNTKFDWKCCLAEYQPHYFVDFEQNENLSSYKSLRAFYFKEEEMGGNGTRRTQYKGKNREVCSRCVPFLSR